MRIVHCIDVNTLFDRFNPDRVATLGFDLAAAHFIVHRGGKVRFKGAQGWVEQDEDGLYNLARIFQPGVYVEEIDTRGVNLVYEGLESISKCILYGKILSCPGS